MGVVYYIVGYLLGYFGIENWEMYGFFFWRVDVNWERVLYNIYYCVLNSCCVE